MERESWRPDSGHAIGVECSGQSRNHARHQRLCRSSTATSVLIDDSAGRPKPHPVSIANRPGMVGSSFTGVPSRRREPRRHHWRSNFLLLAQHERTAVLGAFNDTNGHNCRTDIFQVTRTPERLSAGDAQQTPEFMPGAAKPLFLRLADGTARGLSR